mgnify:CR=1 FL=1
MEKRIREIEEKILNLYIIIEDIKSNIYDGNEYDNYLKIEEYYKDIDRLE